MLLFQSERSKLGRQQPAHGECRLSGSRLRRESPTVCCCKGAAHATPNTCCCHGWLGSAGQQLGCSGSIHLRRLRPGADSRFPLQSSDRQSLFKSHDSQSKHGSVELLHVSPATDRSSRAGSSSSTTGESDAGSARSNSEPGSRKPTAVHGYDADGTGWLVESWLPRFGSLLNFFPGFQRIPHR